MRVPPNRRTTAVSLGGTELPDLTQLTIDSSARNFRLLLPSRNSRRLRARSVATVATVACANSKRDQKQRCPEVHPDRHASAPPTPFPTPIRALATRHARRSVETRRRHVSLRCRWRGQVCPSVRPLVQPPSVRPTVACSFKPETRHGRLFRGDQGTVQLLQQVLKRSIKVCGGSGDSVDSSTCGSSVQTRVGSETRKEAEGCQAVVTGGKKNVCPPGGAQKRDRNLELPDDDSLLDDLASQKVQEDMPC